MRTTASWLLMLALLPATALADAPPDADEAQPLEVQAEEPEPRAKHPLLFYLPNRVFDLMDLVRARVRIGPGIGASARATKPLSATAGFYASLFAGLPGPRGRARIPWPAGVENYAGADVSVFGAATEGFGPDYGPTEIGVGVQAVAVGVDVGLDPLEALDLLLGFVFIDIRDDDF